MCLDSLLTRAELAVILSRLTVNQEHLSAEREFYAGECQFADVPDWAAVYVGYCAFNGFMVGYPLSVFLTRMNGQNIGVLCACGVLAALPVVLLFLYYDQELTEGVTLSQL